jgi:hypothetical protein
MEVDYEKLWRELRAKFEQDATAPGTLMSIAEHTYVTGIGKDTVALMDRMESAAKEAPK